MTPAWKMLLKKSEELVDTKEELAKTKINYRPVHRSTLTNDVQYFPPQERVY